MSNQYHQQHIRRVLAVVAGLLTAFVPVATTLFMPAKVGATSEYANANVADLALKYVGRWGGNACADSDKPGDAGGQCRSFVNCIVWMASGGTQNLGGRDYFTPFLRAGGTEVRSIDALQKGDIVQEGQGRHTFIIVGRVAGDTFTVVDSNHKWNEKVYTYDRQVTLNYNKRAYRMGMLTQVQPAAVVNPLKPMMGNLEDITPSKGGATIKGWVFDADVTRPVNVQVFAGQDRAPEKNGKIHTAKADQTRMDVAAQHGKYGASHGYSTFMPLEPGNHVICVYGVNTPGTPGENVKLGCRAVAVTEK
jgi:hypothetical protein